MAAVNKRPEVSRGYLQLIRRFPLRPIRTGEELRTAIDVIRELSFKHDTRTQDEEDYMDVLTGLIREYEGRTLPMLGETMTALEALEYLMEQSGKTQTEVAELAGCQRSHISAFLSGKRGLSKRSALQLAEVFKVAPELFLS